ncbi:melanocortin-2 receptor accessory protein 2 isoform X1 [Lampetra fluviatilis]
MSSGERIDAAAAAAAFNGSASTRTPGGNRSKEYYWDFEYYDYEPISFEGLRAHRYSIVIGFWVGIASFVLFMFFILVMLVRSGTTDDRRRCSSRGPSVRRRAHALPRSPKAGEMSSVIEPGFGNRRGDDDADEEEEEEMAAMTCIHRELRPGRAALLHAEQECPAAIAMATTTTTTTAATAATATSILYHSDSFDIPNLISESRVDAASGAADVRPSLSD